ncbi:MAG: Uma2 family endonuclease [Gemmatimonadetes bacterium]|nr:Uma2 family endonuclease [Gemmatimonadota bacterium]
MPAPTTEWTLEMLHALPDDGKRYELVDGELLVSPSPSRPHQRVVMEFTLALAPWARAHGLELCAAPAEIAFTPARAVQPDLFVVPCADGKWIRDARELTRLVLAIEVLSPSTAHVDRGHKKRVYMEQGVAEYWIVDADFRRVERWRPGAEHPEVLEATLSWTPPGDGATLELDLVELFRLALD